ncbi:hypothetical protein N6H05_23890 [Sphingobium sp. WTD-1]|uniref:hypothetical protein n=1 Tax=Sphingobium TaxID=165695 RepID=UPI0024DE180D|nr:hypothetical protein [Sphingobium sp. WTD-1]WIA56022.1 hypothetical protein N6H05_23890 [Sphingobium sp. WTD-1]
MPTIMCAPRNFAVSSSNSASNAPASNLNLDHPSMVWRSSNLTSVQITVQLGAGSWDTIALVKNNLRATDTVRIRAANSASNTTASPTYDSGNLSAFSGSSNSAGSLTLLTLSGARTETFIRIDITSTGNPAGYVEAARVVIGKRLEEDGIDLNAEHSFEDTSQSTQYRGFEAIDPFDVKPSWKVTIGYVKEANYWTNWYPLLRDVGMKKAVLFLPDRDSAYLQSENLFGRITSMAKGSPVSSDYFKLELYVREI